ncbi:hypothetical protein BG004_002110, partial [Podila humilis]
MRVLQELIENREAIGEEIQEVIDAPARDWGVKVESVLIKDITFSRELQESLSSAAQAKRLAESKVIGAQAEVDSAKLMRAAADILNTPAAMQIRYLETMTNMAKGSNTRVIFMPTQSGPNEMTPLQANQWEQMSKHPKDMETNSRTEQDVGHYLNKDMNKDMGMDMDMEIKPDHILPHATTLTFPAIVDPITGTLVASSTTANSAAAAAEESSHVENESSVSSSISLPPSSPEQQQHPTTPSANDHHNEHDHLEDEQPFGWVVVAAAFFVQAVVIGTVNGYGIYQDRYISHEFSTASTFELSWIGTLNVMGMDLTGPITGQVADHFGYRVSAFVGGLIMVASLLATSFSTKVWHLYICQGILYGLGASLAFFPSLSLPSQWFKRRRGFATGIVVAGGGFGGLCISPATTALFDLIGYRWTVRAMALLHLAILVPASFLFKGRIESGVKKARRLKRERLDREKQQLEIVSPAQPKTQSSLEISKGLIKTGTMQSQTTLVIEEKNTVAMTNMGHPQEEGNKAKEVKPKRLDFSVLKEREFLILFFIGLTVAMGYFNPYYFFPTYAQKHGAGVSTASLLIGVLNGSSAIGRVTMGLASDYIGDINTLLISGGISALSILVVWMFAGTSVPIMAVFCVMYGFFSGSFVAIIPTVAAHLC